MGDSDTMLRTLIDINRSLLVIQVLLLDIVGSIPVSDRTNVHLNTVRKPLLAVPP